jgi:protein involved in polysaccharide export with SLBB domain
MKFGISGEKWGLQSSEGTQSFVSYQRTGLGFNTMRHFVAGSCSVRAILTALAILVLMSCPSLAQQRFGRTFSEVGSEIDSEKGFTTEAPTQGKYAVGLAGKLGLGENLFEQEAIATLTEVGIEPQGGWQPSNKVTTNFLTELFELILEAAQKGLVTLQPDTFTTQGGYAVQLVQKLALSEAPTIDISIEEAIIALSLVGIKPEAGWEPDSKVDADFLTDILKSTVEAAKQQAIPVTPEEAYSIVTSLSDELQIFKRVRPGTPMPGRPGLPKAFELRGRERSKIEKLLSGRTPFLVSTQLKQFGYDVFEKPISTFAPAMDVPVGPDYIIGPGDGFTVTLWGRVNAKGAVIVDRDGEITLPEVGVLNVSGMSFAQLQDYLRDEFSRKFTDFKMNVTMGKLRTIKVFVVGEAQTPGSYTLSSLSTVINALFAVGGPSKNGTLRGIRLLRNQEKLATIDFYDFLLGGDKSEDVRLQSGDTIFIPLIRPVVGVAGNVKRPAIYEMSETMTLAEVLDLAGGVTYAGWLQRVQVERIQEHEERIVVDFDMSSGTAGTNPKQLLETIIQDGDVIKVFPVLPLERNVVYLEGHVYRPGKYELKPGMRIRDILNSYDVLQRQPNLEYAEIVRLIEPDYHPVVIPFNVGKLFEGDESENIELAQFDTIRVFRWDERIKRAVSISGLVYRPGEYRFIPDMRVSELVKVAGGLGKNVYLETAELTRRHISQSGMQTEKIDINLEKALAGAPEHNIALQDYDHLVIRSIPELEFDRVITISGEVMFPGTYPIQRGETLSSVIERAGAYTERAYLKGAVFTRESAKVIQQQKMNELIRQIEGGVLTSTEQTMGRTLREEAEAAKAQEGQLIAAKQELLTKLKTTKVEGRVVVRLGQLEEFKGSEYDLKLEKGDKLFIPEKPGIVHVVGEVYNATALLYEENKTVAYYLSKVGGPTKEADKKHLSIIRADGSVASMSQKKLRRVAWDSENKHWFFGNFMNVKLNPGDAIVVPRKIDKLAWLRPTKAITEVLFQIALTAGVVLAL